MSRFKGFKNAFSNNNRIYSMEDILKMPMNEFFDRENELDSQDRVIGLPTNNELKLSPNVKFIDSYIDNNGVKTSPRWESYAPINNQIMASTSGLKPFNSDNKKEQPSFSYASKFLDWEEFLRRELEKLKKMNQPVHFEGIDGDEQETIVSNTNMGNETVMPEVENMTNTNLGINTNNNTLSNIKDVLSKLLQSDNKGNSDVFDESHLPKQPDLTDILKQEPVFSAIGKRPDISPKMYDNTLVDINQSKNLLKSDMNNPQAEQIKNQPQISEQLRDYINDLVGDNIDYGFIGNETTTSSQPDVPIYPENGVIKGGISNTTDNNGNKETIGDKLKEWLFTNDLTEKIFPMASHSVKDGIGDLSIAKQNPNATVYNSINDLEDKSLAEKFKKLETDENIKGVVYDSKSKEAQKISKSKELNDYVDEVISNGGVPQKDTFEFKKSGNIFSSDNDLHYSLQNITVHEPKVSEDGKTFTCKIIDVSDFKERPKTMQNIPNNWGYKMQEKGQYKNYFEVIEIKIPLTEEQKELLKKRRKF